MKNKILIIDGNNQLYRAHFSHSNMAYKGQSVSCIYGVPSIIGSIIKKLKPTKVFMTWDGKKSLRRLELLPTYKSKRKKIDPTFESIFKQKEVVIKMINRLGIAQVHDITMEADDYIYSLVRAYKNKPNTEIVIASGDKDFHQLIRKNVTVWDDRKNLMITRKNCKSEFGYTPSQCVDYLCLFGDKSDEIPGYPGCGEVTALKLLKEYGSIENYIKVKGKIKSIDPVKLEAINPRFKELIDLKYFYEKNIKGKVQINYLHGPQPKYREEKFKIICRKYSLIMFQKSGFLKPFKDLANA